LLLALRIVVEPLKLVGDPPKHVRCIGFVNDQESISAWRNPVNTDRLVVRVAPILLRLA